jgi:type IV pilus assembly protein PilY1
MEHLISRGSRRVLTNPAGVTGELVDMDEDSLAAAVGGEAALLSAIGISDADELGDYVDWLLGQDVDDDNGNGNRSETRLDVIGDPLHSKPLALSFGDAKGVRVLMGTNHGYLLSARHAADRQGAPYQRANWWPQCVWGRRRGNCLRF